MALKNRLMKVLLTFGRESDYISAKLGEMFFAIVIIWVSLGILGYTSFNEVSTAMTILTIVMAIIFVLLVWAFSGLPNTEREKENIKATFDILLGGIVWISILLLALVSAFKSQNTLTRIGGSIILGLLIITLPLIGTKDESKKI